MQDWTLDWSWQVAWTWVRAGQTMAQAGRIWGSRKRVVEEVGCWARAVDVKRKVVARRESFRKAMVVVVVVESGLYEFVEVAIGVLDDVGADAWRLMIQYSSNYREVCRRCSNLALSIQLFTRTCCSKSRRVCAEKSSSLVATRHCSTMQDCRKVQIADGQSRQSWMLISQAIPLPQTDTRERASGVARNCSLKSIQLKNGGEIAANKRFCARA